MLGNLPVKLLSIFLPNHRAKWELQEEVSFFNPPSPTEEAVVNSSPWIQEADGLDLNPGPPLNLWASQDKAFLSSEPPFEEK